MIKRLIQKRFFSVTLIVLFLSSCNGGRTTQTETVALTEETQSAQPSAIVIVETEFPTPTATEPLPPMAAVVNGEGILLSDYEEELLRFQDALEEYSTEEEINASEFVLNTLINEELFIQAAKQAGHTLADNDFAMQYNNLMEEVGGEAALSEWLQKNHYSQESFLHAYRRSLDASRQQEAVISMIPENVEQIHAVQILVFEESIANEIFTQLDSGVDFQTLAALYDTQTAGELGWFPRNYLTQPDVEAAVFELQPGEYTKIIETSFGFHIVYVLEKEERQLSPDALRVYEQNALENWIMENRSNSLIEIQLP